MAFVYYEIIIHWYSLVNKNVKSLTERYLSELA